MPNAAPTPNGLAGGALALRRAQRPFDTLYTTTPAPETPGKPSKINCFGAGRGRNPTLCAYIPTINQLRSSALAQDGMNVDGKLCVHVHV